MMVWAEEFCRVFAGYTVWEHDEGHDGIDPGLMVTWLANAFEMGRSTGRKELCPHDWVQLADDMYSCHDCGIVTADPADYVEEVEEEDADEPPSLEESFVEGFQEGRA